ncbi:hypothetical protein KY348_03615 [Candidatus Woesearchaeota archaeon]|nr:hypothetical protein [Candidatus Woesearchaeota archaeon]
MAPIPGWVYVILGIIMILASQLIKDSEGAKPLLVFLYVGILFILIGIGKYVFKAVFRKDDKHPKQKKMNQPAYVNTEQRGHQHVVHPQTQQPQHQASHHQAQQSAPQTHQIHHQAQRQHTHRTPHHEVSHMRGQHEVHRATPQQHPPHMSIIACPACKTRHYDYARYCMRCGTKIKKH